MKGYKIFNEDWTCRHYKFEVGKEYIQQGDLEMCQNGFHFCGKLVDCFNYYSFNSKNKVAEIEAIGEIIEGEYKFCTNKIRILKEISWYEMLDLINSGYDNTGSRNTGNDNTGNDNTGCSNTGCSNTGSSNTGNRNTGNSNTGNRNTGYYNTTNFSSGCFCAEVPKIMMFDLPSDITLWEWHNSAGADMLPTVLTMEWFNNLNKRERNAIKSIPNFNEIKFIKIIKKMEQERGKTHDLL